MTMVQNEKQANCLPKVFTFNSANQPIRVGIIDNEPFFSAKDVCACLGLDNSRQAVSSLDDDEKGVIISDTPGGKQHLSAVNESGLYSLIFQSRKPEAKAFRKWVTSEVLPSIRRTGSYEVPSSTPKPAVTRHTSRREGFKLETLQMLWLIDANLNYGDRQQIALELGVTLRAVSDTLHGHLRSARILQALYQKALLNKNNPKNLYSDPGIAISQLSNKNGGPQS